MELHNFKTCFNFALPSLGNKIVQDIYKYKGQQSKCQNYQVNYRSDFRWIPKETIIRVGIGIILKFNLAKTEK